MNKFIASCRCGNVRLSFNLPVKTVVQCHCQDCRKMQGGDYMSWVVVADSQFSIDSGSECISSFELYNQSTKCFCSSCGTTVYGINGKHFKNHKVIPLGAIENYTDDIKPQIQVYTEFKAPWTKIHDKVPVFPRK